MSTNSKDVRYFTVLKDSSAKHITPRMISVNIEIAEKIDAEKIKFGVVFDQYGNTSGVAIIERDGKCMSQIKDRSMAKLITGVSNVRRDSNIPWNNYTKKAYGKFFKKQDEKPSGFPNFSELNESELQFFIEYLTMLLVKKRVESSEKLETIKGKIK